MRMLSRVLEYKSVEGYPGAARAMNKAIRLDVLDGVRVRDRIMPRRLFAYKHVTVRTRSKEGATGRVMQVEADGVGEDHTWRKPSRERCHCMSG